MKKNILNKDLKRDNGLSSIASTVARLRTNKGLTQEELAKKMGTGQSRISRLESGSLNPSLNFLKRLATALDLELSISFKELNKN